MGTIKRGSGVACKDGNKEFGEDIWVRKCYD